MGGASIGKGRAFGEVRTEPGCGGTVDGPKAA